MLNFSVIMYEPILGLLAAASGVFAHSTFLSAQRHSLRPQHSQLSSFQFTFASHGITGCSFGLEK